MNKEIKETQKVLRVLEGEVVSDKMQKTIVVKVVRRLMHPILGKTVQKSKKYKVHDEKEIAKIGDWVEMSETRPLSKTKHMMLNRVVRKAGRSLDEGRKHGTETNNS